MFLALVLAIIIPLLITVIEGARTNAMEFQTECVADLALESALAEYHKELLKQYDLFFIDLSYGTGQKDYGLMQEHIKQYMNDNFQMKQDFIDVRDILNLSTEDVFVTKACGAADDQGMVTALQAAQFILDKYGAGWIEPSFSETKTVEKKGLLEDKKRQQENEKQINSVDTTVHDKNGKPHKMQIDNPADEINSIRKGKGILSIVTQGNTPVSEKKISLNDYISHRKMVNREGFFFGEKLSIVEEAAFERYLREKCGCYGDKKENSNLDYEIEYLLIGKSSDQENLQGVVDKILLMRETANFIYLLSDKEKVAEAEALALTVAAVMLFPELKDLIKMSILIAWSYAESLNDVKKLLGNGKVALFKTADTWQLSLRNAMSAKLDKSSEGKNDNGLSYKDYLSILLAASGKVSCRVRFMDIVEMDIRMTKGNEKFCIDQCIQDFETNILVRSYKGHELKIKRIYGYSRNRTE